MENREKLEIPTIEFTKVTLMNVNGNVDSSCTAPKQDESTGNWFDGGKETGDPGCILVG